MSKITREAGGKLGLKKENPAFNISGAENSSSFPCLIPLRCFNEL